MSSKETFEFPSIWKIWTDQYGSGPNYKYKRSGTQSRIMEDLRTAPDPHTYLIKNQAKILDAFSQSKEMIDALDKQLLKSGAKVYGSEEAYRYNPMSYGYYKNLTPQQRNRELIATYGAANFKNNKDMITKFQADEDAKAEEEYSRKAAIAEYDTKVANENVARRQRSKELEQEPWYKQILMSEYAKDRYVNEPEKSLFRPESEWYNTGEDVRDLMLGTIGLGADMLPGVGGIALGPIARGVRDVANDQSALQTMRNFGTDITLNAGANLLPNFRQYSRMLRGAKESDNAFAAAVELYKQGEAIKTGNDQFWELFRRMKTGDITPAQFSYGIKQMPDSPMKEQLVSKLDDLTKLDDFNQYMELVDIVGDWNTAVRMDKEGLERLMKNKPTAKKIEDMTKEELANIDISEPLPTQGELDESRRTILNQPFVRSKLEQPELPKIQQMLVKPTAKGEKFIKQGSERVVKAGKDVTPVEDPKNTDYDSKAERKQLIRNLEPQWRAGFIPREDPNDPVYLAYIQWKYGE